MTKKILDNLVELSHNIQTYAPAIREQLRLRGKTLDEAMVLSMAKYKRALDALAEE